MPKTKTKRKMKTKAKARAAKAKAKAKTKIDDRLDLDGRRAPPEVRRLCLKVANQAGKGQWWNAMAYAAELVVTCQNGCHAEIERVAERKRLLTPKKKTKKTKRTKKRKK